ncbi:phosphotransferase [Natranaerobius thermophilus]|uniref:Putative homoserine kinase type II (Protein kinase fold)-like protein n=1 Tax=Natranaerobius thermophilus (strain ATCC BAA-1301 / DSM 18059 / JW/NM-WN-LF) TaxID=457570 RepID=B2A4H8_NATTJ|nr:phosphotransferase [Natranaerobius thermophilus]ACB85155.1 Putative homoserine kinase type II (protein kinase fold)-like protein [Natranaerobius thermophilus JW/NM-WN-LF]
MTNIKDKKGQIITVDEIKWLCEEHDLGRFKSIIRVLNSSANTNILVATDLGKFVLRFITDPAPNIKERMNYIENTVSILKQASLPVLNAVRNKFGDLFSQVNNRVVQVHPYIDANKFNFDDIQIKSSAKILKKFHTVLKSQKPGPLPSYSIHPSPENLQTKFKHLYKNHHLKSKSSLSRIKNLYSRISKQWEGVDKNSLVETIIHDDWHPNNQLYHSDGTVACILDFDGIQREKRIYDVGYAVYTLYSMSHHKKGTKSSKIFLNAYGELTYEEQKHLSLVVASVALFFIILFPDKAEKRLRRRGLLINHLLSEKGSEFFR